MTTDHTKRWTPITRPGGIYCSPGCGSNCTKADHDEAQRKGAELAQRLGPGWKADVWENCRWHYAAVLELGEDQHIRVHHGKTHPSQEHIEGQDKYSAYLNVRPQFIASDTDPVRAVHAATEAMREHIEQLNAAYASVIAAITAA